MFKDLSLQNWRQFKDVSIEFHPRLTVITGANGSGKTTLLNILNKHLGWQIHLVSTPSRDKRSGIISFISGWWGGRFSTQEQLDENEISIGVINYTEGERAELIIPKNVTEQYSVSVRNQQKVSGIFIPSHRPTFSYQRVENIPTRPPEALDLFVSYSDRVKNRFLWGGDNTPPNFHIKQSLIALSVHGYGSEVREAVPESREIYEGFQRILTKVLPPKFGFRKLLIEQSEVILETRSGNFSLEAVSGGITAIFDLAWQLYTFSLVHKSEQFVVIIDEPENHLHPEMQRTLLRNFISAFPLVQFIVATHNPFIVTSLEDSNVYALKYNEESLIESERLNLFEKAGSSNQILRDVLGLETALPLWVEERLADVVARYSDMEFVDETLSSLRAELRETGLDKLTPEIIAKVADATKKND